MDFDLAARRCEQDDLLVAEELAGENHPGDEQSDEGSSGGDGYHSGLPSEFIMVIVPPQVVTLFLHEC